MYLLILYFLFISFFTSFFFGRFFSRFYIGWFTSFCVLNSLILSVICFFEVGMLSSICVINLFPWIYFDFFSLFFNFLFDSLTVSMLIIVLSVSFFVHLYSMEYMKEDPHQIRFFSYISLFTFFMIILVTSGNLVQLFIGWEGVGLSSYLLINFWFSRLDANKSSIMALLTNKMGDLFFLLSLSILFYIYGSFDFGVIFTYHFIYLDSVSIYWIYFICLFFVFAAVGKSAQLGLHIWLPEAMEGPTPVSSLIHAATMVTAGMFLLIRCSFLFEIVPTICLLILFFGSLTTFLGATMGLFQYDMKKIIAYSTCSQLGYMFLSCGLMGFANSFFHLMNHAFFKALLFLAAGLLIHSFSHEQDYSKMGSLIFFLPFCYICILMGSLSLIGFPFFSGFYSKEGILHLFFNLWMGFIDSYFFLNWFYIFCFFSFVSIIFTLLYSIKLLVFTFFNSYNGYKFSLFSISYSSFYMLFPLFFLFYLSILSGFFSFDLFVGPGTDFWDYALYISSFDVEYFIFLSSFFYGNNNFFLFSYEFFKYVEWIPLIWIFYFMCLFFYFFFSISNSSYLFDLKWSSFWIFNLFNFFSQKWIFFYKMIMYNLIDFFYFFGKFCYFFLEKGFLESFGPFGISLTLQWFMNKYEIFLKGLVYHYLGFILLGVFLGCHFMML